MNRTRLKLTLAATALALSAPTSAAQLEMTLENLTHGIYYTPVIIAAHPGNVFMFETGTAASPEMQAIAEGGDISGMETALTGLPTVSNPAGGLMAPGQTVSGIMLDTGDNMYLSLAAMLLPTNDGFVGLDRWEIPSTPGTYMVYLNGYDAGTEVNDELMNTATGGMPGTPGIPGAPGMDAGTGGSGVTSTEANTMVHIHAGNLGDQDLAGGTSDLDSSAHRWLNPVAKLTVTVK